jgi:hypothetical protein
VTVRVFVEGGGDRNKDLQTQCRRGFSEFCRKAGLGGRMPRIVACGGRQRAYEIFSAAYEAAGPDDFPILLIDSEAPVTETDPWQHVKQRPGDGWPRPQEATQDHLHLMVQAMEAWFHADQEKLEEYYGQDFRRGALSQRGDIENIPKADLFAGLQRATKACQKGEYAKGRESFEILAAIDSQKVAASSPHANRLLHVLRRVCN